MGSVALARGETQAADAVVSANRTQKKIGPAWAERGCPPAGYFTKRTAEAWLCETLDAVRRGLLPGQRRTGVTFAQAAERLVRDLTDRDDGAD